MVVPLTETESVEKAGLWEKINPLMSSGLGTM